MQFFDFKVPKNNVLVEILYAHGPGYPQKCVIFLDTTSRYSNKAETVFEFLQSNTKFIAVRQVASEKYAKDDLTFSAIYNTDNIIYIKEINKCKAEDLEHSENILLTLSNNRTVRKCN